MKFVKKVFKPFVVIYALAAVGVVSVVKYAITKLKIRQMYKHIGKLNAAKSKLYRLVFNPYRISNGIRPSWARLNMDPAADLQRCHEIISQSRLARSAC